jgi:polyisoprenyl-phosphate glycosyltransferase
MGGVFGMVAAMGNRTVSPAGETVGFVGRRARAPAQEAAAAEAAEAVADLEGLASGPVDRRIVPAGKRATRVLSIVIPTYNEQDNVRRIYKRLVPVLDELDSDWELIFSVDPCTDRTEELILALCDEDPRVKMLRFSRRFGQPMATIAGLEASSGDAVVVVDCDLQDPPELISQLVRRWLEGYDVVYAQRRTRAGETVPKRIVSAAGYRLIRRIADVEIPPNTGDFRLMSRRVVDNVVSLKEGHGFLRGLVGLVGFRQTSVLYDRDPRVAGRSKYNRFLGSLVIGLNGIVGFSRYPLQLISLIGMALSVLAFTLALVYGGLKLGGVPFPVGDPTIVIAMSFFSGIQLLSLGVIGEYVGRIYDESRNRPKYIVESRHGWDTRA